MTRHYNAGNNKFLIEVSREEEVKINVWYMMAYRVY